MELIITGYDEDERNGIIGSIIVSIEFQEKMEWLSTAENQVGPSRAFHQLVIISIVIPAIFSDQYIHR